MEIVVRNEIDKISENVSNVNFNNVIFNDRVLRKMDSVYERLSHNLIYAELKMEMVEKKLEVRHFSETILWLHVELLQNKLDLLLTRLNKVEDNILATSSNMQDDVSEIILMADDIRANGNVVGEKLDNHTKTITVSVSKELFVLQFYYLNKLTNDRYHIRHSPTKSSP